MAKKKVQPQVQTDTGTGVYQKTMLTLAEGAQYLNISKAYLYRLTGSKVIPHFKPAGKKIYFKVSDLEAYMQRNRIASDEETDEIVERKIREGGLF